MFWLDVLAFLIRLTVVVAVGQLGMVVLMHMPGRPVLPLPERPTGMVMRGVLMIMRMHHRAMGVFRFLARAFGMLLGYGSTSSAKVPASRSWGLLPLVG